MITFDNVSKLYGENAGITDVNITINKGDFVFLVGPSGAGKSTFIKLILREIKADEGKIYFDDLEVTSLSNRMIPKLRRKIGIVFQDFRLLPNKTVYENVAFAMEVFHARRRKIKKKVPEILELVGISSKVKNFPRELSAGEQQRVAIARALINEPDVLIADEPTGNLDPDMAWEIMKLLDEINKRGTTIVMVTHAKDIVDRMGKRVITIEKGRIVRDEASGSYGEDDGSALSDNVTFTSMRGPLERAAKKRGEIFGDDEELFEESMPDKWQAFMARKDAEKNDITDMMPDEAYAGIKAHEETGPVLLHSSNRHSLSDEVSFEEDAAAVSSETASAAFDDERSKEMFEKVFAGEEMSVEARVARRRENRAPEKKKRGLFGKSSKTPGRSEEQGGDE